MDHQLSMLHLALTVLALPTQANTDSSNVHLAKRFYGGWGGGYGGYGMMGGWGY